MDYQNNCKYDISNANFTINTVVPVVTSPNGGEIFDWDKTAYIYWDKATYYSNVRIEYSSNGGSTWNVITTSNGNNGYYAWTIPQIVSNNCLVRVSNIADLSSYDVSDAVFSIQRPMVVLTPNGGESLIGCDNYDITLRKTAYTGGTVYLQYSADNMATWNTITTFTNTSYGVSPYTYTWQVPNPVTSSTVRVRAYNSSYPLMADTSDANFTITPNNSITVTAPNGGEQIPALTNYLITWTNTSNASGLYIVQYRSASTAGWTNLASNISGNSYLWTNIPNVPTNTYQVRVMDYQNNCKYDLNNTNFTISPATPIVSSPNGGETLWSGNTSYIYWDKATYFSNVRIEYSTDAGSTWNVITTSNANNGYYAWTVPQLAKNFTNCLIKVSNVDDLSLYDVSDNVFTIKRAITILTPNGGDILGSCTQTSITFEKSPAYSNVNFEYSLNNGTTWVSIAYSQSYTTTTCTYNWSIPTINSTQALVRVTPTSYSSLADVSDSVINIKKAVTILQPNYGGILQAGTVYPIKWQSDGISNIYDIAYSVNGGTNWTNIIVGYNTASNTYSWTVPILNSTNSLIRVMDNVNSCKVDISANPFTISASVPPIKIKTPNGAESLTGCQSYNITWSEPATAIGSYNFNYSTNGGTTWTTIATNYATTSGTYSWIVPNISAPVLLVKVASATNATIYDVSDAALSINKARLYASNDTVVCAGSVIQLNVTGGFSTYTWSGSTVSNTAIANPTATINNNAAFYVASSSGTCTLTDTVLATINTTYVASIKITSDATASSCKGSTIHFLATATNAGNAPVYKWYKNGTVVGTNANSYSDYVLNTNDSIWCVLNSNLYCIVNSSAKSNVLKMSFSYNPVLQNITLKACNSMLYNGVTYTSNAVLKDTIKNIGGCDSIYKVTNISITPVIASTLNQYYSNCKSYTYKGITYTTSASVRDTVKSVLGCDSIYNVANISITGLPNRDTVANTCGSINWYGTTYTKDTVVSHQIANNTIATLTEGFNAGVTAPAGWTFTQIAGVYTSAGNYGIASPSLKFGLNGDQIITPTLNGAATQLSFWIKSQTASGSSLLIEGYNGTSWTAVNTITSFPLTASTITYNATSTPALPAGLKQFRFTYTKSVGNISLDDLSVLYVAGAGGCDSLITLHLTLKKATTVTNNLSGCKVTYKGITYFSSTTVRDTIKTAQGCDSIYAVTNITVTPLNTVTNTSNYTGCNSVVYNGTTYTTSTAVRDTIRSQAGCDSIYKVANIVVKKITATTQNFAYTGCNSYQYNGTTYTATTVLRDTIKSKQGCDSIYNINTINVKKITPLVKSTNYTGCDSVVFRTKVYKSNTTIIDTTYSYLGCDSVYTNNIITISKLALSGNLITANNKVIPKATISVSGASSQTGLFSNNYSINCIAAASDLVVRANKNNDVNKANGVTTLDIALIQSNILQKSILSSPYKLIAADVNGDGKVTTLDIVYIKRLILGLDTTFSKAVTGEKKLWAFVDSSYVFPTPSNPFPYKDSISYTGFNASKNNQTFIGCKLGDVNWDWNPAVAKPYNDVVNAVELSYTAEDVVRSAAIAGSNQKDLIRIPVRIKNFKEMLGMQFTIGFNASAMQWQGLGNNPLGIETGTNHAAEGSISFLWVDANSEWKTMEDGTVIMELLFKATGKETTENILDLNSSITSIAAYNKDYNPRGIVLKAAPVPITNAHKETWVVAPNPVVNGVIQVQADLKEDKRVVLRLMDNTGRLLLTRTVEGVKGKNNFILREGNIPSGMYYLQALGVEGEEVKKIQIR